MGTNRKAVFRLKEIIRTYGLTKKYAGEAKVKDVALLVPEHNVYGFLGPNGAGKSTTLKMILGLVRPTQGEIDVFGKRLNPKNRLAILKQVGSLIESPSYYGHLTGYENLKIMQTLLGVPEANIGKVLDIVRLADQKDKRVDQYSLGMKQRLGIATAMLGFPRLLILDEPTNGLDPAGIQEMRELVLTLPKEYGMTVLVSSHLLSEVDQIADVVGIIHQGTLVFQSTLASLHEMGQGSLAIRTQNNVLAKAVLSQETAVCEEGGYLLLEACEDRKAGRYSRLLAEQGVEIYRMEERKKSLEDIFLELTKEGESL